MNVNKNLTELVNTDGQLDETRISSREAIYTAKNGKQVERFSFQGESYIFKPCSMTASTREQWAQQFLIPLIPTIRVPRLLASGYNENRVDSWIIYEDLGLLTHISQVDQIIRAAGIIPLWHRISRSIVPSEANGHSPRYSEILDQLINNEQLVHTILAESGIAPSTVSSWLALVQEWATFINNNQAVSHGDYYRLNIAFRNEESIVLDWEYAHLNSVYWDIYSLMDITSYRYVVVELDNNEREAALRQYWLSQHSEASSERYSEFSEGYYVFASVYSVWILTLIEADLQQASLSKEALLRQRCETKSIFMQLIQRLNIQ